MAKRTRNRGAEPLSKALGIGRNRIQDAITYLRNIGAIETITVKFANGSPIKSINITDLGNELVNMIVAQRAYQSNAQSIKTQDSILNTLVNLR